MLRLLIALNIAQAVTSLEWSGEGLDMAFQRRRSLEVCKGGEGGRSLRSAMGDSSGYSDVELRRVYVGCNLNVSGKQAGRKREEEKLAGAIS